MAYDQFVGYAVQGLCTGIGTALALFIFEKYLKPTLEKNHERLAKIPIPVPPVAMIKPRESPPTGINPNPNYRVQHDNRLTGAYVDNAHTVKPQQVGMPKW
jgi:hypothetical protein